MRLTTKGRYAVTAMLDLAIHGLKKPVSLNDISGRQGISLSYLEQLFAKLRRHRPRPGLHHKLGDIPNGLHLCDLPVLHLKKFMVAHMRKMPRWRNIQKG